MMLVLEFLIMPGMATTHHYLHMVKLDLANHGPLLVMGQIKVCL